MSGKVFGGGGRCTGKYLIFREENAQFRKEEAKPPPFHSQASKALQLEIETHSLDMFVGPCWSNLLGALVPGGLQCQSQHVLQ